jgi:ubiquinone/menaquinone biosynthesis C-methylase UbiE
MLLNRAEFALMNNPVRAWIQRRVEAPRLLRMAGPLDGGVALEVGCGRGRGVELILDHFRAAAVDAFDLDRRMVARARSRLRRHAAVRLWVADCVAIPAPDGSYDAVFDFGIIHHVPDWRAALAEVARVLKPGGRFYAEEVLGPLLNQAIMRRLFEHPRSDRFDARDFAQGLSGAGLVDVRCDAWRNAFAWFTAAKPALPHRVG